MNEVAKNIRRLRTQKGITQEEAAGQIHISRQGFSNWETGRSQPDIESLTALAEVFEVDVNELIYGKKSVPPEVTPENRRRHVKWSVILGALYLIFLVAGWLLYPYAKEQMNHYFTTTWYFVYALVLAPVQWLLLTMALVQLVSIWHNLQIGVARWRRALLLSGAALLALFIALVLWAFVIPIKCPGTLFLMMMWCFRNPMWALVPGILLAVGMNH